MGVDQLVTGGDVDNPVFDSVTTTDADIGKLIAALDANGYDISNIDALEADSLSIISPGLDETKEVIGSDINNDSNTVLNLSVSVPTGKYQHIILVTNVEGRGVDTTDSVSITVSGETANYDQDSLDGGSITQTAGNSSWTYEVFDTTIAEDRFLLSGNAGSVDIAQQTGQHKDREMILRGRNAVNIITSVGIETPFNAKGNIILFGLRR